MKRLVVLFFLIFIIVISGCGQQQTIQSESTTDGIVIKDFSFDQSEVYAGDYASLNLEVQNIGEVGGNLTNVSIYGGWSSIPIYPDIDEPKNLEPANPSANFEGESKYIRERIKADTPVQSKTDYQFGVRVKYDYTTEYIGTVRFVNPDYLDTLSKQQKDSLIVNNGIISSSVSNGPLNINPISGRSFIVESSNPVFIKFGIKNVGSGYPYISDGDYSVKIISQSGAVCPSDNIRLSRGETGTFICNFSVPSGFSNYVDRTFKITFDYSYYTDGSTSITVNPSGLETTTRIVTTTIPPASTSTTTASTTTTTIPNCGEGTAYGGVCKTAAQCTSDCAPRIGSCVTAVCDSSTPCCCICTTPM